MQCQGLLTSVFPSQVRWRAAAELSGSERQRLKLAIRRAEEGDVDVLDEPTSGLHLADVERLLGLLDRLVDSGKSAIVIAQVVMAHADWIIDLGHGAGHDGGRIVFEGTPPSSSPPAPLAAWACLDGRPEGLSGAAGWLNDLDHQYSMPV